jgi:hypothetical protein
MQIVLFTSIALAVVTALGIGVAAVISALPLSILARAHENGRFAGLGSEETQSRGNPAAGMPIADAVPSPAYAS